jgi:hypothetical protein
MVFEIRNIDSEFNDISWELGKVPCFKNYAIAYVGRENYLLELLCAGKISEALCQQIYGFVCCCEYLCFFLFDADLM